MNRWLTVFNGPAAYKINSLKADIVSGLTVALVLIPQSLAYAELAGLPSYYGLYASLLPPLVAALFGSSRQLATGPVAVVSLLTATALEPLATQSRIITALDDPMIPPAELDRLHKGPSLAITVTRRGGHCGFVDRLAGGAGWIDREVLSELTRP